MNNIKILLLTFLVLSAHAFILPKVFAESCCSWTNNKECTTVTGTCGGPYPPNPTFSCDKEQCTDNWSCKVVSCSAQYQDGTPSNPSLCGGSCPSGSVCTGTGPGTARCEGNAPASTIAPPAPTSVPTAVPPTAVPTAVPVGGGGGGGPNPTSQPPDPPGCNCTNWGDASCGGGSCSGNQRQQTRQCDSNCSSESRCVSDSSCNAPAPTPIPVAVQARCKVLVNDNDSSCAQLSSSTSYAVPCDITLDGGSTKTQTSAAPSSYVSWSSTAGQRTIDATSNGFSKKFACVSKNGGAQTNAWFSSASAGDSLVFDIAFSSTQAWSQASGGDVTACTTVKSILPSAQSFMLPGGGGYPGVVSYKNTYNFDGLDGGSSLVSPPFNWLVKNSSSVCTTNWYQYFASKADSTGQTAVTAGTLDQSKFPTTKTIYTVNGDLTTSGAWNVTSPLTIFVNGNVTITDNITTSGNGFFALIANGDIHVASTVGNAVGSTATNLSGLYVTSPGHSFYTGTSSAAHPRLVVKGTVLVGNMVLERNPSSVSSGANDTYPGELFQNDPKLLITLPDALKAVQVNWREVAP